MSWTCRHKGKVFQVSDGKDFMIADRTEHRLEVGAGYRIVTTTYRQDGTYSANVREYPPVGWITGDEPLPDKPYHADRGFSGTIDKGFAKVGRAMAEANDTFFKLGNALDPGTETEPEMLSLTSGTRVRFRAPVSDAGHLGTIVGLSPNQSIPKGFILVCADSPSAEFRNGDSYTGKNHGVIVSRRRISRLPDQTGVKAFAGVPQHIGIVVETGFDWDDARFRGGTCGRLLHIDGEQATISWHDVRNRNFYISDPIAQSRKGQAKRYENCYSVPTEFLRWCRWDSNHEVCKVWPGGTQQDSPKFEVGDYVVYTATNATRATGDRHYAVARGTILRIKDYAGDRGRSYVTAIVGGGTENGQGLQVSLPATSLAPLGFPYFLAGNQVEIVAPIEFKKRDLRGQRGVVILPTDADGDVGVQFQERIGAGSLDGVGKNLHCLYVPTSSVRKI